MKSLLIAAAIIAAPANPICAIASAQTPVSMPTRTTPKSEAIAAITIARQAMSDAWRAKDAARILSYYADDIVITPPGMAFRGIVEAKAFMQKAFKDPGFSLDIVAKTIDAADAGDMGFARGSVKMSYTDATTGMIERRNYEFLSVFARQPDGTWKMINDMSTPAAGS